MNNFFRYIKGFFKKKPFEIKSQRDYIDAEFLCFIEMGVVIAALYTAIYLVTGYEFASTVAAYTFMWSPIVFSLILYFTRLREWTGPSRKIYFDDVFNEQVQKDFQRWKETDYPDLAEKINKKKDGISIKDFFK